MTHVTFKYDKALSFFDKEEIKNLSPFVLRAHQMIHEKIGAGNDFLGWVDLPKSYDQEEYARIKKSAEKIKNDSDVLLVIGIGGSYLGAKAALEMLNHSFQNLLPAEEEKHPR